MNRYKKTANTARNQRILPQRGEDYLVLSEWVALPVSPINKERGDLNAEPLMELKLRKQEADFTNYFLIQNNQPQRYEKKSEWLINKWRKKSKE